MSQSSTEVVYVWMFNAGLGAYNQFPSTSVGYWSTRGWAVSDPPTNPSYPLPDTLANLVDAKGDLFVGTADNVVARFPVGSDGRVLVADATTQTGLRWAPVGTGGADTTADALALFQLLDLAVGAPGALTPGRTNVLTAAGTYTAPAPQASVATPPRRFAVRNDSASTTITVQMPDSTGAVLSLSLLPGMARIYRQVTASGYGLEDGIPMAQLDARYVRPTLVDAAGDLLIGTADDTLGRLAAGTAGQALIARPGSTPALAWETLTAPVARLAGSGPPEGSVTAVPGSQYVDTAATLGAYLWTKRTGNGSTGWRVTDGDTGVRDIRSVMNANYVANTNTAIVTVQRINYDVIINMVQLQRTSDRTSAAWDPLWTPSAGFGPLEPNSEGILRYGDPAAGFNAAGIYQGVMSILSNPSISSTKLFNGRFTYRTAAAWPTTLPGSAV